MRLSARAVVAYQNINSWRYASEWVARSGEPTRLYFQLIDADQDGIRYIPQDPAFEASVTFPALDPSQAVTKIAAAASPQDLSLLYVDVLASDVLRSGNVVVTLVENGVSRSFALERALVVETPNRGSC
jgi:hypothetical protein